MPDAPPLLQLIAVTVRRDGTSLLAEVPLTVSSGERVVILGANGAGKSTLLKVANGVIRPDSGRVIAPPRRAQAHIFQRPALLARSAIENVEFVLAAHGVAASDRTARAERTLHACDLASQRDRMARTLSGGEQQRLALACAWVLEPELLFADEPTANLAPVSARAVEHLLLQMHGNGATLVMTTHNVAQARRMATRVVYLDAGRLVEDSPAEKFFHGPVAPAARAYFEGETL